MPAIRSPFALSLALLFAACLDAPTPAVESATARASLFAFAAPKSAGKIVGGYVLTHEHPTNGMAFGGNYAFAGAPGNYKNGVMEKGYTAECGGCKAGKKCDHGEVKGSFTGAVGALGSDMGDHKSHMGPVHDSNSHLRYSTEWIKAAYDPQEPELQDTRLKIMVAFAVESEAMCEQLYYANAGNGGAGGAGYACSHGDTMKSLDRQIGALKDWARANASWMEIAYTAGDARRIVNGGKLAIVLGVESDYAFGAEDRTFDPVERLDHYWDLGVRTFYIAHKINSRLAGADIYRSKSETGGKIIRATQAMAGCFYVDDAVANFPLKNDSGHEFCNNTCGKGGFKGGKLTDACVTKFSELSEANYLDYFLGHGAGWFNGFDVYPKPPGFSGSAGSHDDHGVERNNLGLSHDGERVVREAMLRGMIVNIDHTSSRTRTEIDALSKEFDGYPLNALHNNPNEMLVANSRGGLETPGPNEYDFDDAELQIVKKSGGFFGVRVGPVDAKEYKASGVAKNCPKTATETAKILAYLIDQGLTLGYALDYATVTEGVHSRTLENCGRELGGKDQLHKYGNHIAEGLTHIGMMKYWHEELAAVGLADKYLQKLENDGPEAFVKMWERSEAKSKHGKQIARKTFKYDPPSDGKSHGELCTADQQCKSNRCAWGMCADKDECRDSGDCSASQYCGDPISGKATCKALKSQGEGCTKASQCATDRCSFGKCAAADQCNSNSDCGSGRYCGNPIAGKQTCKDKKSKGDGCTHKDQCKSNQCSWGFCK
ncbi:MAG TPA: membrane dipeptidase [Nannocystaceae bacterium]|nr:membrane dipeptidase [Nannocystaceae bacterium]